MRAGGQQTLGGNERRRASCYDGCQLVFRLFLVVLVQGNGEGDLAGPLTAMSKDYYLEAHPATPLDVVMFL